MKKKKVKQVCFRTVFCEGMNEPYEAEVRGNHIDGRVREMMKKKKSGEFIEKDADGETVWNWMPRKKP